TLVCAALPCFAQGSETTVVPIDLRTMRPIVEAYVNGEGPFKFVVDTGASGTMVSAELAKRLKLPKNGSVLVSAPNSPNMIRAPQHRIRRLVVGDITFFRLNATAILDEEFARGLGADGILSAADFRGYLVTFDYRRRRMLLTPGELPEPDGESVLSYTLREQIPGLYLQVAGERVFCHLDSGSPFYIALPGRMLTTLEYERRPQMIGQAGSITGTFSVYEGKLAGDITFGKYKLSKPNVQVMDKMPYGNLGYRFFREYLITFDFSQSRVKLQHWREVLEDDGGRLAG
ncbi:MAG: clan AA aspartic protease, partial [Armatimonadetes bacterium]|nr:clan AA aspartic protease [Armatimonadota bacterium]